ncbi:DAK2 domain-containing protein [Streptomyces tanashiensis]|uniref:DAK2 domain-containing protein n=1 Tax=Streptomyces tanashiensis TaxID=67367 RepID=A0ABY6QUS5_9ACTN|nr:DAK2 domain-containing protein [Streptomyces tanashiensis]UZX21470.1 DAK2 domain-containing protein [Streptomyces tanashiensis]
MSRALQPDEELVELDAEAVRTWCARALDALGREREEIDAINVYPVADGDTGTNLYLTAEAAHEAVEAVFAASSPDTAETVRAMAHGALLGARGNSGTILAQLLRGMAAVLAEGRDGDHLARALAEAAAAARQAVAHPVEGTVLTVATAAADGCAGGGTLADVAARAHAAARTALAATPGQLDVLGRAGVVDAGGRGLVAVLGALVETVSGRAPDRTETAKRGVRLLGDVRPVPAAPAGPCEGEAGPAYEVIYLLEAEDAAVDLLRARLDALGDSLVVVGGDGLWNVHVHVDDAGAAVEAGVEAGRPHRIRITHFAADAAAVTARGERAQRAVVAVVPGEGLAGLCAEAGATTVRSRPGEPPAGDELVEAIRRAHAREVVLLPNDTDLRQTAAAAAERARAEGIRVALIPTRAAVQGIAALAVHEPDRRFDEDVVAMTAAAGATRYAELAVAEHQSFTSAGVCQAGDILGLIEGDVAVIGKDLTETARTVLDRMLSAGGELVTLVVADDTPPGLASDLERHVRRGYLAVDTTTYHAGAGAPPLLIGVE